MKKLLALLIAVMMVLALVPATVLSAIVPTLGSAGDGGQSGESTSGDTPDGDGASAAPVEDLSYDNTVNLPDERVEGESAPTFDREFTEGVDKLELVNAKDELVGYFADLAAADAWVRNGDTLRFLADITLADAVVFGAGRASFGGKADAPVKYTIDGNGKMVDYRGEKNYALWFSADSRQSNVLIRDLTVVAAKGCFGVGMNLASTFNGNGLAYVGNSGGTGKFVFENCKLYANDAYGYENPDYYVENDIGGTPWVKNGSGGLEALWSETINTDITVCGADTVMHGNNGYAVNVASVMTILDGFFYSAWADAAVQVFPGASNRSDHKLMIYGGTFVNDRLCAARALNGAQLWIFGGDFVMTGETTTNYSNTAAIRTSGGSNRGHVYIMGGNFYMDAANDAANRPTGGAAVWSVMDYSPAYIAGGRFYHAGADNAFGGNTFNFSRFGTAPATAAVTENNTKEVYSYFAHKYITWNYVTSVSFNSAAYGSTISADGAVLDAAGEVLFADDAAWYAATGAEVAILDADGNIVGLLDVDNDADAASCIHMTGENGTARMTDWLNKLRNSWYFVPNGGTWRMITDINGDTYGGSGGDTKMFHYGANIDVTVDGNGHLFRIPYQAKYINYTFGSTDVTFKHIIIENPVGRTLQYGNSSCSYQTWTLAEGAVVRAGIGSPVYLCPATTLNVLEGAVMEWCPDAVQTEHGHLIQMRPCTTFNLLGGTLKAVYGNSYAGSIFYLLKAGNRTINLVSGEVYLAGDSYQALRMSEGVNDRFDLNVYEGVSFYTMDGTPALQPPEGNAAEVTNVGEAPVQFATFAEAMAAVKPGAVVRLLRDVRTFGTTEISCDMTLLGNGYTVYDSSYLASQFVFHVRGANTDVLFDDVSIVTAFSGIYVSPNEQSQYNSAATGLDANDSVVVNVTLNNCEVYASVFSKDGLSSADRKDGEADLKVVKWVSRGALYQHGESTYVKVTGADSVYACGHADAAVVNYGGYLDIYDGFVYGYDVGQVMWLRGRHNVTANTDNQMQSATTAIYGGMFLAGQRVAMSVARTALGHHLVIVDGEFIMTDAVNPADGDRHVIRASESSKPGYLYVLGGDFYQSSTILPVFGWGKAEVAYFRIWGGNFWGNSPTGIQNRHYSTYSFNNNTCGVDAAYGMYIDDGYQVKDYTYTEDNRAYAEDTESEYVKDSGYLYHQTVLHDDAWLVENGYKDDAARGIKGEGYAYIVTDSATDSVGKGYYSFELERALYQLGNGGTFTLVHDVNFRQPAKATKDNIAGNSTYGVFGRYRPAASAVTFTSTAKNGTYTITADATAQYLFTLAGGSYTFDNFGLTNTNGGMIRYFEDDMSVTFRGGRYYGFANGADGIKTNGQRNARLTVESGEFTFAGTAGWAMFAISNNAEVEIGKQGKAECPNLYMDSISNLFWLGSTEAGKEGAKLTIYNVNAIDIGGDGRIFWLDASASDYELAIYGGEFLLSNTSLYNTGAYWPLLQSADGSNGTINIYGGDFVRANSGIGKGNYGKLFILEGDGTVNITGGSFRQDAVNTLMTIRKNTITVNLGDPVTGEGPTFFSPAGNTNSMIWADDGNTTDVELNIYGGAYTATGGALVTIGKTDTITGTLNIYGGVFTMNNSTLPAIGAGHGVVNVHGGEFYATSSSGGLFASTGNGTVNLLAGTYKVTGNKCLNASNGATFNVYGGNYDIDGDFLYCGSIAADSFTINVGQRDGSDGPVINAKCLISTWLADGDRPNSKLTAHVNIYSGTVDIVGNAFAIYHRYGEINVYGGDIAIHQTPNRLMRIGGYYEGEVNIYGGSFRTGLDSVGGSDCVCVVDNSSATVVLGKPDGTGPVFYAYKESPLEVNTKGKVIATIYGGSYTTEAAQNAIIFKAAAGSSLLIEGGEFYQKNSNSTQNVIDFGTAGGTMTINGGSFYSYNNGDSCVTVSAGTGIVNGGYFYGNGMCIIRAIGGTGTAVDGNLNAGAIITPSTAVLIINGGTFYLDSNWLRDESDTNFRDVSVVRGGGWTGYGTITINGGTFINASKVSGRVINKINPTSTIYINGGIFMASAKQEWYFYSTGNLYNVDGELLNEAADPDNIPVDRSKDRVMSYNGVSYHVYMSEEDFVSYHKATERAEIRLVTVDMGDGKAYVSGMRFTTTMDGDAIAAFAEEMGVEVADVVFGTLIVPEDFLEGLNAFTHADLIAAGRQYLDIAADKSLQIDPETGDASFTAAITEILPENYGRSFIAVGYMQVTTPAAADGEPDVVVYDYANYTTGASLAQLASILLEREANNPEPYSPELKALLQTFAAKLPEGTLPDPGPIPGSPDDTEDDNFPVDGGDGTDGETGGDDVGGDPFP